MASIKLTEQQKMTYDDLSMPEKVAILLIQLGEDATTQLFSHMEVDVITEISRYIATARSVDKAVASAVLDEFYALMQSNQYIRSGGLDYAKEILYRTFGPEAAQKSVHEARFTCIWTTHNNRRNTISNEATCIRCGQEIIHGFQNRL